MREIEDAFRILDLEPGASLKEVVEARDDMLALWNPGRFPSAPRLRSKAPDKIREIHDAYETLMRHLGEHGSPGPSPGPVANGSASLYDEVFSKGKRSPVPLWLIIVATAALLLAGLYLSQFVGSAEEAPPPVESPAEPEQTPAPAESAPATAPATEPAKAEPDHAQSPSEAAIPPNPSASSPKPATPPAATTRSDPPPRQGPKPLLKHREIGSAQAREAAEAESRAAQAEQERQQKTAEKAFQDLLTNSEPARGLAKGQLWNLRFDHWQVVQQTDSEVWIDLVALHADGKPAHHIWAVRIADGQPRPLSEAARDLESVKPGVKNGG